jgi:membrane-associated protease RseP (regulator of RpoE activity)
MPELARAAIALPIIFAVAGLTVLVHELGPKLIERVDRRGTTWCISLVPIRGYVALHPDTIQAGHLSFWSGPVWVELVVTAAGPAANLILTAFPSVGLALTKRLPMSMFDGRAILVALAGLIAPASRITGRAPFCRPRRCTRPGITLRCRQPARSLGPSGSVALSRFRKSAAAQDPNQARCSVDQAHHGTARSSCRDPSMQAVIRDDHNLFALLHAGERHRVPRVAEASGARSERE